MYIDLLLKVFTTAEILHQALGTRVSPSQVNGCFIYKEHDVAKSFNLKGNSHLEQTNINLT